MTTRVEHAHTVLRYALNTAELAAAEGFYTGVLGLHTGMRTEPVDSDGTPLGLPGSVRSRAASLHEPDRSAVAPALELVEWISPETTGEYAAEPNTIGLRALGYRLATLDSARERLSAASHPADEVTGGVELGAGTYRCVRARDPDGVAVELVEDPAVGGTAARASHVRLVCADLKRSAKWYRALGFELSGVRQQVPRPGGPFGLAGDVTLSVGSLSLPGDPGFSVELEQWHSPEGRADAETEPAGAANRRGLVRIALAVDDLALARAALAERPVDGDRPRELAEPAWMPLPRTNPDGTWVLALTDPDGVAVALVERARAERNAAG